MIFHVIIQSSSEDKFSIRENADNKVLTIPSFYSDLQQTNVSHNIKQVLSSNKLIPSEEMIDFGNICLATYTIDQLISRQDYGYYQWSRYFKLYVPVLDTTKWSLTKHELEECLSFLSGDKWEVTFRPRDMVHTDYQRSASDIEQVSLFSGGLDSFIGSIDLLEQHQNIALVSHHKGGGGGEKSLQENLISKLNENYEDKNALGLNFYVQPFQSDNSYGGEDTQRARSIIFIALGLLVANSIGANTTLIVPENGLISLNVPLTTTRYGSYSTRTTHPNFLNKVKKILSIAEIPNGIENPYRFKTKGEMIAESRNIALVKELAFDTISCSKPGHYVRWQGRDEIHCGNCVPCIIRRSSMYKSGFDQYKGNYVLDVHSHDTGENLRAFKIGLAHFSSFRGNRVFQVLKCGPIPCSDNELKEYIAVYERGMREVGSFLNQN